MRRHDREPGGFADDRRIGTQARLDQCLHPKRCMFLVRRQRHDELAGDLLAREPGGDGKDAGHPRLHVGGPPPEEAAATDRAGERVRHSVHAHRVEVAVQQEGRTAPATTARDHVEPPRRHFGDNRAVAPAVQPSFRQLRHPALAGPTFLQHRIHRRRADESARHGCRISAVERVGHVSRFRVGVRKNVHNGRSASGPLGSRKHTLTLKTYVFAAKTASSPPLTAPRTVRHGYCLVLSPPAGRFRAQIRFLPRGFGERQHSDHRRVRFASSLSIC